MTQLTSTRSMFIDAILFVLLATLPVVVAMFASDEAAKYMSPESIFWLKNLVAIFGAAMGSVKAYRSLGFAHHIHEKAVEKAKSDKLEATSFLARPVGVVEIKEKQKI